MTTTEANIQFTIAAAKSAAANGDWSTLEEIVANAFIIERKDARAAAYEDAAKIAERRIPSPETARVVDHLLCSRDAALAEKIAADIRAKAKEITNT